MALAVTALGGALLMYAVKIGTLAVLIGAERRAPDIHAHPVSQELMVRAGGYRLQAVYDGIRRFGRRAVVLALGFGLADLFLGLLYLLVMGYGLSLAMRLPWLPAWPLLVIIATTAGVVAIVGTNLAFDLLRVIVVTDDCSIPTAFRRLMRFAIEDSRQVVGIFSVIGGVMVVATAASILAAAGLAAVAWVPLLGLIVVPLQAAAWIVRGLIFQYLSLASLVAYETQYRRFSEARWPATASRPERVARVP
jgi:hypothetical protein